MKYIFIALSLFLLQHVKAQSNTDRIMDELTETIHKTADYDYKNATIILPQDFNWNMEWDFFTT